MIFIKLFHRVEGKFNCYALHLCIIIVVLNFCNVTKILSYQEKNIIFSLINSFLRSKSYYVYCWFSFEGS